MSTKSGLTMICMAQPMHLLTCANCFATYSLAGPTLSPQHWYANTEPLSPALTIASIFTGATFILGELTQNWSYVDRVWAVLPVLYSAHFTFHDRWSGAGSVKGIFDWSSKPAAGAPAATWFSAFVPNGVNDRMFLVFLLQVSRAHHSASEHSSLDDAQPIGRTPSRFCSGALVYPHHRKYLAPRVL